MAGVIARAEAAHPEPRTTRDRAYDVLGEKFERVMNRYDLERRLALVVARVPPSDDVRALEVGCGLGYRTERVRRDRGIRTVSLDIARSLLKIANARGRVDQSACGDALALPFPARSFDLVF